MTGFVNGEDNKVLTKNDVLLYAVDSSENELTDTNTVGEYTITAMCNITADNYELTTVTGTLTIELTLEEKVKEDADEVNTKYETVLTGTVNEIANLMVLGTNDSTITWTSDTDLVSVDNTTGKVTIINNGEETISVTLFVEISMIDETGNASIISSQFTFTVEFAAKETTATKSTSANGWNNSEKYTSYNIDENITASVTAGTNTGKYYSSDSSWRLYQNESAKLTITAASGYKILSVKVEFTFANSGLLTSEDGKTTYKTGESIEVSGSSIVLAVGGTASKKNGQIKIASITVVYTAA